MFLFQSPSIFPLNPSPTPQHNTTPLQKDLRKQIHKHEQPPAIYTDNQQVEEIVVFLNGENSWREQAFVNASFLILKNQMQDIFLFKNGLSKLFD